MKNQEFYKFIESHSADDTLKLKLSLKKEKYNFDFDFALMQIENRRKHSHKFKDILENRFFIFPDNVSAEQATHQAVALYHSKIAGKVKNVLDMTAGLGIDSLYLSKGAEKVISVELNKAKVEALKENAFNLGIENIKVTWGDAIDFLKNSTEKYDLIFVDPSRRDSSNSRVYNLSDCSPDVIKNQKLLLEKSGNILIKASPLLDITQTIRDFENIVAIHAVGVKGECKELLIELSQKNPAKEANYSEEGSNNLKLIAINLDNDGNEISSFIAHGISSDKITYAEEKDLKEGSYILEPSAMIMKVAPWGEICNRFKARKMSKSSHLFISDKKPDNFPGRTTIFQKVIKKSDRKTLKGLPVTVVSKNYPLSSTQLRQELKVKEGDKSFIYATRLGETPLLFLTSSESISG